MFIIVGLGNPERKYDGTRHNIGFSAITVIADKYNISMDIKKLKAVCRKRLYRGTESHTCDAADIYELKR